MINFLEESKIYVSLVAVALIISITGCDSGQKMAAHLTPILPPSDAVDPNLVRANTRFGFKLLNELRETDTLAYKNKNTLISPFSVSIALAMARNGAAGETERAMRNALQLQALDPQLLNVNYVFLQKALQAPDSKVTLKIANSLWGAEGIEFDPGFLNRNRQFLDTEISTLDFTDPNNVSTINESVAANTNGGIPNMIPAIDPATVLCLISGIYFKGSWQEEFDVLQTREEPFNHADGSITPVSMMRRTDWYPYYADADFQAVSLPFGDGQMGMYIFLPSRNTNLKTFLAGLSVESWEQWMTSFFREEVSLVMPKFKLEYAAELRNALSLLGMGIAFDRVRADLSRTRVSPQRLYLSYVSHTAIVEVNEEGTEAATGTFVFADAIAFAEEAAESIPPIPFIVDRPFFFAIRDNQTGTVLFMGVVVDPLWQQLPPPEPNPPRIFPLPPAPIPAPLD
ncbi:MAG: serpin family protein [Candidatus Poribacteria bacterium]|nr:serpin family protein [Candidatus Poribacteria bacterium]